MRRFTHIGLLVAFGVGCAPEQPKPVLPPQPTTQPPVAVAEPTAAPVEREVVASPRLIQLLASQQVHSDRFSRRVLFTWTTRTQANRLRAKRWLLTRKLSPSHGMALFDRRIRKKPGPIEKLLATEALAYRRFAWSSPWATLRGWTSETYGSTPIMVVLKPEAVVGRYDSRASQRWTFTDLDDKPVPLADVLAKPQRLAAVYHVWHGGADADFASFKGTNHAYREYVLCNESMIESWEAWTERVQRRLAEDLQVVIVLAEHLDKAKLAAPASVAEWNKLVAAKWWAPSRAVSGLAEAYESALAFPNGRYTLTLENVLELRDALKKVIASKSAELRHFPTAVYGTKPPLKPPQPRPRPKRRCGGTFC